MYFINSYNKNRGSPAELSQERCLIKEIGENAINRHLQFSCQYPHINLIGLLHPTENKNDRFFSFIYGLSMLLCTSKFIFIRIDGL